MLKPGSTLGHGVSAAEAGHLPVHKPDDPHDSSNSLLLSLPLRLEFRVESACNIASHFAPLLCSGNSILDHRGNDRLSGMQQVSVGHSSPFFHEQRKRVGRSLRPKDATVRMLRE